VPGSALFFWAILASYLVQRPCSARTHPSEGWGTRKSKACDDVSYKVHRVRFADRKAWDSAS
jgi:hypothetical protein